MIPLLECADANRRHRLGIYHNRGASAGKSGGPQQVHPPEGGM